jgi:hypothetical protein
MRLWSLHPEYLDPQGLVALWREGLLAQAVLKGQTRGYTRHPQLSRFLDTQFPLDSIARYLHLVHHEATVRGYRFDSTKIHDAEHADPIYVTQGQLEYEWAHLKTKLSVRSPAWLSRFDSQLQLKAHTMFIVVDGDIAKWEVVRV